MRVWAHSGAILGTIPSTGQGGGYTDYKAVKGLTNGTAYTFQVRTVAQRAISETMTVTATPVSQPSCNIDDLGERRTLWQGRLTAQVDHIHDDFDRSLYRLAERHILWVGGPGNIHGTLTPDEVTFRSINYSLTVYTRGRTLQLDGLYSGISPEAVAAMRLHVCDTAYNFSDHLAYDLRWNAGFNWPPGITRTLRLSLPPNRAATGAPVISGTARVGEELTALTDGIMDEDGLDNVFNYQWVRVDGTNETDLPDATSGTYTLTRDDVDKTLKVRVSFIDLLNSKETRPSAGFFLPNSVPTAADSAVMTDEDTAYTFTASDFSFADTDGDALAAVTIASLPTAGALALDNTAVALEQSVPAADIGKLVFTPAANANGDAYASFTFRVSDATQESASAYTLTVNVTAMNDPATGAPTIGGTAQVDQTLTAATAGIADVDGLTSPNYSYQWIRVDGADEMNIDRATSGTYTPVQDDVGKTLKVTASFTDDAGTAESLTSAPTATVTAVTAGGIASASAAEGDAITFTVTLTPAATRQVTVDYATSVAASDTAAQTDFTASNGTLTFAVGETEQTFTVATLEDSIHEPDETFTVTLDNVSPAGAVALPADPTATGTITNDDATPTVTLVLADDSIRESDDPDTSGAEEHKTTVTASLSKPSAEPTTVTIAPVPDAFTVSGPLTIPARQTASSAPVTLTAVDNDTDAPDATVTVSATASNGLGVTDPDDVTLTIRDDDVSKSRQGAAVRIEETFVPEGDPITIRVTLAAAATETVTVDYATSVAASDTAAQTDFTASNGTLTFAVGETQQTFTVSTLEDRIYEDDETFTVTLSNVNPPGAASLPANPTATETIVDDDNAPVLVLSVAPDTIAEAGGTSTVTVSTGTGTTFPDDRTITLTLTGTATETDDYTIVPRSLTLPAGVGSGAASGTATVTAADDDLSEGDETILIDAALGTGNMAAVGTRQTLTIIDAGRHATGAPAISGTAQVGMVLTASPGTIADADGLAGVSHSYQWIRVDGADEMNIDRATSGTYTPVQADVGKTLTVRASFTDNAGNAEQRTSAPTATVIAANRAPAAADALVTTREDNAYTFAAGDFNFSDANGDALASVKITSVPTAGTFTFDSATVTANKAVSRADVDAGKLRFSPAPNANGNAYANFAFTVNDGTDDSADEYTITINVTAVNDPPTAADNTVATAEDNAYIFTAGDFNFSDADTGDALSGVKIVSLPTAGTLALDSATVTTNRSVPRPDIDAGKLRFTPAANANGDAYASFAFKVNDGTEDSAANYNMTIDVTAANDPPTAADKTVTTAEDTPYTFTVGDFNFSDPDGDDLANVKIVSLPTAGTLALDSATVTRNRQVLRADIAGGKLRFTPAANANGDAYEGDDRRGHPLHLHDGRLQLLRP